MLKYSDCAHIVYAIAPVHATEECLNVLLGSVLQINDTCSYAYIIIATSVQFRKRILLHQPSFVT